MTAEPDATARPGDVDPDGAGPAGAGGPGESDAPGAQDASGASDAPGAPDGADRVHVTVQGRGIDDVLGELREAGLEVDEALEGLGIVTGRAAPDAVERMNRLPGVTVEPEGGADVGPPDAPLQ